MRRSIGVTVIAVLSLLGSLFMLLMAALMVLLPFLSSKVESKESPFSPGFFKLMMLFAALMYLLPAIWGIVTSIGLLRLKEWARISIIVFSVLLILMSGFSALMFLVIPMPLPPNQPAAANVMSGVHVFMTLFAAGLMGIGIWWLVFFTRAGVKQQFVPVPAVVASATLEAPQPLPGFPVAVNVPTVPTRPLSLTIIAWLLLVGCVFLPISILLRYPAAIFTKVVTGWPASAYYLVIVAAAIRGDRASPPATVGSQCGSCLLQLLSREHGGFLSGAGWAFANVGANAEVATVVSVVGHFSVAESDQPGIHYNAFEGVRHGSLSGPRRAFGASLFPRDSKRGL